MTRTTSAAAARSSWSTRLARWLGLTGRTPKAASRTLAPRAQVALETLEGRDLMSAAPLRTMFSAVTIANLTKNKVSYAIVTPQKTEQWFSLKPNQQMMHTFNQVGAVPTICYDAAFATGYQEQRWLLPTKPFVAGGMEKSTPTVQAGMKYCFAVNSNNTGLNLHAYYNFDLTRYTADRAKVKQAFPSLGDNFEVLSPGTYKTPGAPGTYNCIAWSMGIVNTWVWPTTGQYATVADLESLYYQQGFSKLASMDYSVQPGYEKVVIYGNVQGGVLRPTHGALQNPDGTWSSKLGSMALIRHATPDVFGGWDSAYGKPIGVFVRAKM